VPCYSVRPPQYPRGVAPPRDVRGGATPDWTPPLNLLGTLKP